MLSFFDGKEDGDYTEVVQLFGGEKEILFAVILQNGLHPKNSQRSDAIKAGTYVEINTLEQAREFIKNMLRTNLTIELKGAESSVVSMIQSLKSASDIKMLVDAPDVYIAAAALSSVEFFMGRGDRSTFFKVILELNPRTIPDLAKKLKLITSNEFMGLKLYNDKLFDAQRVCKRTIY